MYIYGLTLSFLLPSLALYAADSVIAIPSAFISPDGLTIRNPFPNLYERVNVGGSFSAPVYTRDGHSHGHAAPILGLNETEVLQHHAPTPPSYWSIDVDGTDPGKARHPSLMVLHASLMTLAFFFALPTGIALRSVNHAWYGLSMISFWTFIVLGCGASGLYRKLTPNMSVSWLLHLETLEYEGQMHCTHGYLVLALAFTLSAIDVFAVAGRVFSYVRTIERDGGFSVRSFWYSVILSQGNSHVRGINPAEYTSLVVEEPEELEEIPTTTYVWRDHRFVPAADNANMHEETAQWSDKVPHDTEDVPETPASDRTFVNRRSSRGSQHSDDTLQDKDHVVENIFLSHRLGQVLFGTLQRFLVFAGFAQFMHGIVIYTGGCRGNYLNGCLAHIIKGGIFWCYGLVTFARFLGSFSELGWAWNRAPIGQYVSAEFVESLVIFVYGITNTWMERFGAHPGDPYTTKEIQHISIAVMFWFAGMVGMGLESRRLRRWLAAVSIASMKASSRENNAVAEPASYSGSFNPFPALVIGVTGAAMSAHHQTYLFQVQIHALWGYFLTGFALLRCLTYFFVWLNPRRSILPSRPPSEALASFFLSCGGLVFILSDEEITFAAMRRGYDDVMMFLNLTVAITCFAFCWTMLVVGFKGWLKSRTHTPVSFLPSA
ncbi:hypothetical protein BJV74DRAFT_770557 [Russula compacta]|nr:hypothetical protein BJV74DRAFT_770557 [Russula compacta]